MYRCASELETINTKIKKKGKEMQLSKGMRCLNKCAFIGRIFFFHVSLCANHQVKPPFIYAYICIKKNNNNEMSKGLLVYKPQNSRLQRLEKLHKYTRREKKITHRKKIKRKKKRNLFH